MDYLDLKKTRLLVVDRKTLEKHGMTEKGLSERWDKYDGTDEELKSLIEESLVLKPSI